MNYREALHFLESFQNISHPSPSYGEPRYQRKEYRERMKRLQYLLNLLGNPEKKIPHYIHITGTSGKGSTSTMIANILSAAGITTGLFTSPHIVSIRDRWQVHGRPMNKQDFIEIVSNLKKTLLLYTTTSYQTPTFHDLVLIIGLYYFAQKKVTWAVIEVYAGGTYDPTMIIPHKDTVIITSIGLDHTRTLGATKKDILIQKSGLINSPCQVFTTETNPKLLNVLTAVCNKRKARLTWHYSEQPNVITHQVQGIRFTYQKNEYTLPLLGIHQVKNAQLAIEVTQWIGIKPRFLTQGLQNIRLPLRLEVVAQKPLIIVDGAHNQDKLTAALDTLTTLTSSKKTTTPRYRNIHVIIGFAYRNDFVKLLKLLKKIQLTTLICTRFTKNSFLKAMDPTILSKESKKLFPHLTIKTFLDPQDALQFGIKKLHPQDLLLITGSVFLGGELRSELMKYYNTTNS
jgi:dihydrofolate synthase/folylpolyglutamate synthase